jgi:hypothetical protein
MTMGMAMSGSREGQSRRERLAEEERLAHEEAQRQRLASRMAQRSPGAIQTIEPQGKPLADAWRQEQLRRRGRARKSPEQVAERQAEQEERERQDARAAKARAKDRRKVAESGVGPKVALGFKEVKNPYAPEETITVAVNLAEHPLEMMLARGRLSQPLYEAGVRFRMIYERAAIGPGRGIDPAKIKVDGGRMGDPLSDSVVHAQFELARIIPRLGHRGSDVVIKVCGLGQTVSEVASRYDLFERDQSNRDFVTGRLKEVLEFLSDEVWGAKGPERGTIAGERDLGSGAVDDRAVEVANQRYLKKRGIAL